MPVIRVSALGTDAVVDGCLAAGTELAWARVMTALPTAAPSAALDGSRPWSLSAHVVIGQRARGGCPVMMRLIKERPPGAVVRAWCPKRSEEDVLWVRVAA